MEPAGDLTAAQDRDRGVANPEVKALTGESKLAFNLELAVCNRSHQLARRLRKRRPPTRFLSIETGSPTQRRGRRPGSANRTVRVSESTLIQVTDAANTAFGAFDFAEHDGKGVRVFVQGFG